MLFTKCILEPTSAEDGERISIMSRHTLNDGKTPDKRILESSFDVHFPNLGPAPNLIGPYLREEISWNKFAEKYLEQIRMDTPAALVRLLAHRALHKDITLLCIEECPERCHRRLLAEECKRFEYFLAIVCR